MTEVESLSRDKILQMGTGRERDQKFKWAKFRGCSRFYKARVWPGSPPFHVSLDSALREERATPAVTEKRSREKQRERSSLGDTESMGTYSHVSLPGGGTLLVGRVEPGE